MKEDLVIDQTKKILKTVNSGQLLTRMSIHWIELLLQWAVIESVI